MAKRIVSVDVFRGMTIALMILVNNAGDWGHIYRPFEHAEWFGVTPTDWVFPFFLFIVGTSIVLAYHRRDTRNRKTYKRIFTRTLKLLLLGWFLAGFKIRYPFFVSLDRLRIPGVLVRIAVVFFFGALLYLLYKYIERKAGRFWAAGYLVFLTASILLGYWYMMIGKYQLQGIPTSELIETRLSPENNLVSEVDKKILGTNHMWRWGDVNGDGIPDYDPEGLLSTLPSLASVLLGMFLGLILVYVKSPGRRILWMLLLGGLLVIAAFLWEPYFPFSKKLWTSSYALYMAGLSFLFFAVIYFLSEFLPWKGWMLPFVAFGMNAIAIYVLNGFIAKSFYQIKIGGTHLHNWIFRHTWGQWISVPEAASLAYAFSVVLFYTLVALYLYRKKIFIKV